VSATEHGAGVLAQKVAESDQRGTRTQVLWGHILGATINPTLGHKENATHSRRQSNLFSLHRQQSVEGAAHERRNHSISYAENHSLRHATASHGIARNKHFFGFPLASIVMRVL
jgi:hypothetical protein